MAHKQKIILWGHPPNVPIRHTQSYIWESLYRTFKHLGYNVWWFADAPAPVDFDFTNCIFISEGFNDKHIPLRESSTYFVHVCINPKKYLAVSKNLIDLRFLMDSMDNDNYDYILDRTKCETLDTGLLYDSFESYEVGYKIAYIAWGTNLLPHEIDLEWAKLPRKNVYNYIGTISTSGRFENGKDIYRFAEICKSRSGANFYHVDPWINPVSEAGQIKLIQESILSPDFRSFQHQKWGYLPCRVMKSISYGQLGLTNSLAMYNFLEQSVIYGKSPQDLFDDGMRFRNNYHWIQAQMRLIQEKHTYVNRVNGMMKLV